MKNIKSFKLFEAFKSDKLSKTLAFINKDSKSKFLEQLKTIANKIDLPYSEYSDDYFQYLPFRKALKLNQNINDAPCDAKSVDAFPDHSVPGAVCGGTGRLDRTWGRTVRNVVCPVCSGTGVKPKTTFDIKWIKFWFSKDGEYITTTGTDGRIRNQSKTTSNYVDQDANWSRNIDDYVETTSLTKSDIHSLPTGSYVKIFLKNGGRIELLVGRIFKADRPSSRTYIIQDSYDGSEPDFGDWQKFGRCSWVVASGDEYTGAPKLLIPKSKYKPSEIDTEPNAYEWNNLLNMRRMVIEDDYNMDKKLTNAHFALVLDYLDLKRSEYKSTFQLKDERGEAKKGALALVPVGDIKAENIERYLTTISKNLNISADLSNIDVMFKRILGYSQMGYYILQGRNAGDLDSFVTALYKFMSEKDPETVKYYYTTCKNIIERVLSKNMQYNKEVSVSIESIKKTLNEPSKQYLKPVFVKIEELNVFIADSIKNYKIETYEDLESLIVACSSIKSVWKNSDRFKLRDICYSVDNIKPPYRFMSYFEDINESEVEFYLSEIERFKKVVSRILN